jgi:hypothetical protein
VRHSLTPRSYYSTYTNARKLSYDEIATAPSKKLKQLSEH